MIELDMDTQRELERIAQSLERLAFRSPEILRLSINSAARKVRKSMIKQVGETYTVKDSLLRDRKAGAPTVSAARKGSLGAVIRSKGPVNDLVNFLISKSSDGAKAQVLRSGGLKTLEQNGARAFLTQFENKRDAVAQRQPGKLYTVKGAANRIQRYGSPTNGAWPDMTRIVKLMGPAVPSMLKNQEVQNQARDTLYLVLNQEIDRRVAKAIRKGGGT